MGMPPDIALKQMVQTICERGYEISVSQTWRYSTHITPPGITTQYEVRHWENGKPTKVANCRNKIELFYWLQDHVK